MVRHTGIPNMRRAKFANPLQRRVTKVVELANTVFFDCAPGLVGSDLVAEQASDHLIDNGFSCVGCFAIRRVDYRLPRIFRTAGK